MCVCMACGLGGTEFKVVCCCCCTVVAYGNVTKLATEREVEKHGCLKLPKGKSSESMEACLAEMLFAELKTDGFECCLLNITLDGDSKTAAIVKKIFPNCNVWDCFSHMLVNFRKRLTDLGNHKVGKDGPIAWFESHRGNCPKRQKIGGGTTLPSGTASGLTPGTCSGGGSPATSPCLSIRSSPRRHAQPQNWSTPRQ